MSQPAVDVGTPSEPLISAPKPDNPGSATGQPWGLMGNAYANAACFALNVFVVYASNLGWWGKDNATVSNANPTFVTPAGWAFSIWAVIFISEFIFTVWQVLPSNRESAVVRRGVGIWFAAACLFQVVWTFAFAQEQFALSAAFLLGIAISLAAAVVSLTSFKLELTWASPQLWLVHFPLGLHAGWTCAAALVNVNLALYAGGLSDSGQVTAAVLTAYAAFSAGAVACLRLRDAAYAAAVAWALGAVQANGGYREEKLGSTVANGLSDVLNALWVILVAVIVVAGVARMRSRVLQ